MLFTGDYYFVRAVNEMVRMKLLTCPGAVSAAAETKPTASSKPAVKTSAARRVRPFRFW